MTIKTANQGIMQITPYKGGDSKLANVDRIIRLASNECPHGASPKAIEAMQKAAVESHRYPDGLAKELRTALAEYYDIKEEQILCGSGSDEILALACNAFISEGDESIYTEHGFLMYRISTLCNGGIPVPVKEINLKADVDAILAAVTSKTKIVFIANPNNPTGSYISKNELHRLHAGLPKDVLLVVDGAYREYVELEDYSDGRELVSHGNVLITGTFSKMFGLGGMRVGWGYASPKIIDIMNRVRGPFNVNAMALAGATAALKDIQWQEKIVSENNMLISTLTSAFTEMGITVYPSAGNFLLLDFATKEKAIAVDTYLREKGVIVRQTSSYGLSTCLRMTIGAKDDMEYVVAKVKEALNI